jgi:hypothetical protein
MKANFYLTFESFLFKFKIKILAFDLQRERFTELELNPKEKNPNYHFGNLE